MNYYNIKLLTDSVSKMTSFGGLGVLMFLKLEA
jgi:hypothetical protein